MLSSCVSSLNGWSLLIGRISIVLVAVFSLVVVARLLANQPQQRNMRMIPRPILVFTASWATLLLGVTVAIMAAGCEDPLSPLKRTLFGTGLTWSLFGMTWVVYYGAKWREKTARIHAHASLRAEAFKSLAEDAEAAIDTEEGGP